MNSPALQNLLQSLNKVIIPLAERANKYDFILDKIADARFVLIGEATHGTQEFYQARAKITQLLIERKGFMAVAIEGDWPDTYQIHRFIQRQGNLQNPEQALSIFKRFPMWMWRNTSLIPFLNWLRQYNDEISPPALKIGFYGLDLYSLYNSMQAVIEYLNLVDPPAAERARTRYACFDHLDIDPQNYGYLTNIGIKKSCIKEAVEQLMELQHNAFEYISHDGIAVEDRHFFATQNARLVTNAEYYYRAMFNDRISSWNVRDQHMAETFNVIADHLEHRHNTPAKIVVWAHNSHVGDARATEVAERGELNIGQLIRQQYSSDSYLLGFSTYQGSVTAASEWGGPAERKTVLPALKSSYEELFHELNYPNFFLDLKNHHELEHFLNLSRLQRAIGVIYRPETERASHYYFTRLPYQFDGIIHLDQTSAVQPIDINPEWK